MTDRLWHYTNGLAIGKIVKSGVLLPSLQDSISGAKPAVWCSTNPEWEDGATRAVPHDDVYWRRGTILEVAEEYAGLFRIEVDPDAAPLTWPMYRQLGASHDPARMADLLATSRANPDEWRCSLRRIGRTHWRGVEAWALDYLPARCQLGLTEAQQLAPAPTWIPVDPARVLADWHALECKEPAAGRGPRDRHGRTRLLTWRHE